MAIIVANNNSLSAITSLPAAVSGGAMTLLSTQTASSSSTVSFTSGIDSTYKEYVFKFINIHPQTDDTHFTVNFSVDSGSNYNVTKTTTLFVSQHAENAGFAGLSYQGSIDLAQSTSAQQLCFGLGNDNDENMCGTLRLFDPSSTTFVKHFLSECGSPSHDTSPEQTHVFVGGYGNTTSAIDAVQFAMSSGNIDSGTIKLYGIS
tara:strand:+ start:51 stop:662 length:612 start_codon:yes stop_codon:yes gene_type:complete